MQPEESAVEVRDLRHRYGEREALKGISFTVRRGEVFGLLGPNGGGKTTLFRILSTLMVPTSGSARIFDATLEAGVSPSTLTAVRRQIGVAFQAYSLDKQLTVAENLTHQGHLYGFSGRPLRRRVEELLEQFRLADRARDKVKTLSGGLGRRVDLAKAILHRPRLLLLDEPSTGLDPGARRDLWDHLLALRGKDGVTVLMTTHILEEAEHCDRVGILHLGELVAVDSPGSLKGRIGGDVVSIETSAPAEVAAEIRARLGNEPQVVDGTVRFEQAEGHRLLPALIEAHAGRISAVTVGRPTLEDVFIRLTGHRFWEEADEAATATGAGGRRR